MNNWGKIKFKESHFELLPDRSGIYIFYTDYDLLGINYREYLYIGKSSNIRRRIREHSSSTKNESLKSKLRELRPSSSIMIMYREFQKRHLTANEKFLINYIGKTKISNKTYNT